VRTSNGVLVTARPITSATAGGSDAAAIAVFAEDVRYYLTQTPRQLPSRYLYDALGSALFDAICELPWYRITSAETRLLAEHAPKVWSAMSPLDRIIELGAGDGRKLAALLSMRPRGLPPVRVDLVDVSAAALESAARTLAGLGGTHVVCHQATYEAGVEDASGPASRGRALVLFLGSNIGNFDPPSGDALLRHIRLCLRPGDALLLGADLVKPERDLLLAYDDPLGVTGAFNLNLLVRINRELGADFDPACFAHRAIWNARVARVEMHLVSTRRQTVRIPAAGIELELQPSETIWTESSYKYQPVDVVRMIARAGFEAAGQWEDGWARFALTLCEVRTAEA
jgi:dimethylhistidine N-methyltransferase